MELGPRFSRNSPRRRNGLSPRRPDERNCFLPAVAPMHSTMVQKNCSTSGKRRTSVPASSVISVRQAIPHCCFGLGGIGLSESRFGLLKARWKHCWSKPISSPNFVRRSINRCVRGPATATFSPPTTPRIPCPFHHSSSHGGGVSDPAAHAGAPRLSCTADALLE